MQDDVVERLGRVERDFHMPPSHQSMRNINAIEAAHDAKATILFLREQLEKAEGALRECQSAIGDWSRPTGANGMTTPAEDHPLLWVMGLVRAYFAAQEPTLQQIKDTPA